MKSKRGITCLHDVSTSWRCNVIHNFLMECLLPDLSLKFSYLRRKRMKSNMVRVIEYINNKKCIRDMNMGRWWRVPERREKERGQSRGGRRRKREGEKTKRHPSSLQRRREDSGQAQWPYVKSIISRNPLDFWSENCHLHSGWGRLPNTRGVIWDSRSWPSSPYKRQQRCTWSTSLRMQICMQYMQKWLCWCQTTSSWPVGSGGIWLNTPLV